MAGRTTTSKQDDRRVRHALRRGFNDVSTVGLESSPVAAALAGLRAHEARYFKNKYDHVLTVEPASIAKTTIDWVHLILKEERDIVISSRPLEATAFQVENIRIAYVLYENGLSINVMYTLDDPRSGRSGSSSPKGCKSPRSSPPGSNSRDRSRSWPAPSAVPTSPSKTITDLDSRSGNSIEPPSPIIEANPRDLSPLPLPRDSAIPGREALRLRGEQDARGRRHRRRRARSPHRQHMRSRTAQRAPGCSEHAWRPGTAGWCGRARL
jgi:hypothetical protein